jgi:protocatechuate 3,4-dioxygenase beta subunit
MDSHFSSLTTFVFDSLSVVDQADAIGRFLPDRLSVLANHAGRLIHRCHVADPAFDAEDAVQEALLEFWRATRDGKFASGQDSALRNSSIYNTLWGWCHDDLDEQEQFSLAGRGAVGKTVLYHRGRKLGRN